MSDLLNVNEVNDLIETTDRANVHFKKRMDSPVETRLYFSYTKKNIMSSLSTFSGSNGYLSNGTLVVHPDITTNYFKVPIDIRIEPRSEYMNKLVPLTTLLNAEVPCFVMYMNLLKIPDDYIYVYYTDTFTDVFIKYYDAIDTILNTFEDEEDENLELIDFYVEHIKFNHNEYIHGFRSEFNGSQCIFTDAIPNDKTLDFDLTKIMLFVDGKLIVPNNYYTATVDKNISVSFFSQMTNAEIELVYDYALVSRYYRNEVGSSSNMYFKASYNADGIDINIDDPILGGINIDNCRFYINGLLVPNNQIIQKSRHIFSYAPREFIDHDTFDMLFIDLGKHHYDYAKLYNSDYHLQKMVGNDVLINLLTTSNIPNTSFLTELKKYTLNYNTILNKNDTLYNNIQTDDFKEALYMNNEDMLKKLEYIISRNPSSVRNVLERFANNYKEIYVDIRKEISGEYINVGMGSRYDKTTETAKYEVFIQRDYKSPDILGIQHIVTYDNDVIRIPKILLPEEIDVSECNHPVTDELMQSDENDPNKPFMCPIVITESIEPTNTRDRIDTLSLTSAMLEDKGTISADLTGKIVLESNLWKDRIVSTDDLVIIRVQTNVEEEGSIFFMDNGYQLVSNYVIRQSLAGQIIIEFSGEIPTASTSFILYNKRFNFDDVYTFGQTHVDELESLMFIGARKSGDSLPLLHNNNPEIFVDGIYFIYGIDYMYITLENNSKFSGSLISFTRSVDMGSTVTVSFSTVTKQVYLKEKDIICNSNYGLMYFSKLPFPYSNKYLDLYIDGKLILDSDVDILSDKLIRVRNVGTPFYDVYCESNFRYDYETIRPIVEFYKEDDFEKVIANMFTSVDYASDKVTYGLGVSTKEHIDDIYKSMKADVGQHSKGNTIRNPINEQDTVHRNDQYNILYLQWLRSTDARTRLHTGEYIENRVLDYFSIYNTNQIYGSDIMADTSSRSVPTGDIIFDARSEAAIMGKGKRLKYIIDHFKNTIEDNTILDIGPLYTLFVNNPVSNIILPVDFPFFKLHIINLFDDITTKDNIVIGEEFKEMKFDLSKLENIYSFDDKLTKYAKEYK